MRKPLSLLSPTLRHKLEESPDAVGLVPFGQLVGGVLTACIEAQSQASELAWQYTKEALFQDDPYEEQVATVTFTYVENTIQKSITIPLLTLVPAPYLKMDDIDLDFNAEVSVDNDDQSTLMANVGSSQIDIDSHQAASMDTNLHIKIKARAGQPPAGLISFLRMVGNNGIIIEDDSETSAVNRPSHHIDGELQLDQTLVDVRAHSQGSGGRPLSAIVLSIRAGADWLTRSNKPLPNSGSGSGRRGLGSVINSISSGAHGLSSQGSGSGRRDLNSVIGSISSGAHGLSSQGSGSGRRDLNSVIGSISSGALGLSSQGSGRRDLNSVIGSISSGAHGLSSQGSGSGRRGLNSVIGSISSGAHGLSSQGSGSGRRGLGSVIGSINSGAKIISNLGSGRRYQDKVNGIIRNNSNLKKRKGR